MGLYVLGTFLPPSCLVLSSARRDIVAGFVLQKWSRSVVDVASSLGSLQVL